MEDVCAVILGGGRGTRLSPLTLHRSKPAVPIGGKYRLIDVPVSNCLHSGIRRIFVLTQYQSESLNKHLSTTYKFDIFSSGFVTVLAAEQTEERSDWFQGTADAVRQCMRHLSSESWEDLAILSGDSLYRIDFHEMLRTHRQSRADATIAVKPVPIEQTHAFGIMKMDATGRIGHFDEKPPRERLPGLVSPGPEGATYLASMGIYLFRRRALEDALSNETNNDFGRHVIPSALGRMRIQAHLYDGYWEDVGTVRSYFEANIALTDAQPAFNFYDARHPVYTQTRFLPATKVACCDVLDSLISEGCWIERSRIEKSVIGIRSRIATGARLRRSLILGADYYETADEMERARREGQPMIGIGEQTVIENAIIDKNARIGRNCRIVNESREQNRDAANYAIRDGVIVALKGAVIPDGTVI